MSDHTADCCLHSCRPDCPTRNTKGGLVKVRAEYDGLTGCPMYETQSVPVNGFRSVVVESNRCGSGAFTGVCAVHGIYMSQLDRIRPARHNGQHDCTA